MATPNAKKANIAKRVGAKRAKSKDFSVTEWIVNNPLFKFAGETMRSAGQALSDAFSGPSAAEGMGQGAGRLSGQKSGVGGRVTDPGSYVKKWKKN